MNLVIAVWKAVATAVNKVTARKTSSLVVAKMSGLCKFHGSAIGCKRSDQCRFSHSNPESVRICKYYQTGNCQFGSKCRYRHLQSQLPFNNTIMMMMMQLQMTMI